MFLNLKPLKLILKDYRIFGIVLFTCQDDRLYCLAYASKSDSLPRAAVVLQQEYPEEKEVHIRTMRKKSVAPPPPVVIKHESVQAQSEDDKVQVAVRAIKDTWIQVKADDKVVFEMTLSKGSMETWSADNHIELSGRNIEQLDMEVNEKHVGFLGGGERRIRKVLITKEGLTVKK